MDIRTNGNTDRQMEGPTDEVTKRWTHKWTNCQTGRLMDRWTDGRSHLQNCKQGKKEINKHLYNILLITRYDNFLHHPSAHHAIQHLKSFRMICCTILFTFFYDLSKTILLLNYIVAKIPSCNY